MSSTSFTSRHMPEEDVVCRFCAQTKSKDEILSFSNSEDVLNNCLTILDFFKIDFIHLNNTDNLPRSICMPCYALMQNAYSFFKMVQHTQTELSSKYLVAIKIENPDDQVKIEKCIESIPVQTDSKPKECKEVANSQYTKFQKHIKLLDFDINDELKTENVELPDYNVDADIGIMYAGFSEDNKSWNCYSWKCAHCPSTFTSLSLLRSHSTVTHRTCNAFTCNDCTETYETFDAFVEHVLNHKQNLRYFCRYCNCQNQTIEECITHEQYHIDNYIRCNLCGELFENTKLLSQHKRKLRQLNEYSEDSLSSLEFNDNSFEIPPSDYKIESWKDYPWICRLCNIAFKNLDIWRSHNKEEHKKCGAYKCFDCDAYRPPNSFRRFISHIRQHRQNLSLQCYICNEIKEDAKALTKHVNIHKYNLSCEMCGENFTDKDVLNIHMQMYNKKIKLIGRLRPLTTDELTCKVCNKVLISSKHLSTHKWMHKQQIYPCDKCGKLFKSKSNLENHILRYNKKYECDICGKFFAQKSHISRHLATHTDERPFCCDTCGFKCRDIFNLKQHKLRHTTYAPFICRTCNKAFKTAIYLKRHEVQHTGEKPYACNFCDKTFTNFPNRHKHMKRIHAQLLKKNSN